MITNFGLTRILSLTLDKFWQLCDLALPAEAINEDGTVDREKEHQIAAGWYATEDGHDYLSRTLVRGR